MEKNFLSLIKTRRSVRAYKSEPVPSKALDAVLEAGTYAPTGGGHQSPTIIAITDPDVYKRQAGKYAGWCAVFQHSAQAVSEIAETWRTAST